MKNTSIASKTVFASSAILISLQITTLLIFWVVNNYSKKRIIDQEIQNEVSTIQLVISESYTLGDIISLRRYLDSYSKLNSWESGKLIDAGGQLIWQFENPSDQFQEKMAYNSPIQNPNGGVIGNLSITKNISSEDSKWKLQLFLSLVCLGLIALFGLIIQTFTLNRILKPVSELATELKDEASKLGLNLESHSLEDDIYLVKKWFNDIGESWRIEKNNAIELSSFEATAQIASQVSHDIRSPLAALEMISGSLHELPEDKRLIIRNSINRIRDISNSLLSRNKLEQKSQNFDSVLSQSQKTKTNLLLGPFVDSLITEKRTQFRDLINISIEFHQTQESYGLFANIQPDEFQRVLSNIINNSVEALVDQKGKVELSLTPEDSNNLVISIKDNGKGIPSNLISEIGFRGKTFGKTNGSGLGLFHAKQTIESFNGTLSIESKLNEGTFVTITLPRERESAWFVPELVIHPHQSIIVFDDDQSIHQIWKERFDKFISNEKVNLHHFSTPQELKKFYGKNFVELDDVLFLMDFEISGSKDNGLDVIQELGIQRQSILVTSRYEEPEIRHRCDALSIRLIPKNMSGFVPIKIRSK